MVNNLKFVKYSKNLTTQLDKKFNKSGEKDFNILLEKHTRLFTKYPKFDDWDNKESIIERMDDLYRTQAKNAKTNLLKACTTFSWKDA